MIYQENFEDLDEIVLEYQKLVKALPKNGLLLLNYDDERIKNLKKFSKCRTIRYGLNKGADLQAVHIEKIIDGQKFEINGGLVKVNRFGRHHIYAKIIESAVLSEKF
jgi:UDP-N-acetylmuramate-alanine ligase